MSEVGRVAAPWGQQEFWGMEGGGSFTELSISTGLQQTSPDRNLSSLFELKA